MDRMKFEGRMNYFMLTAIRSAKNEDGLISDRDLKAIELMMIFTIILLHTMPLAGTAMFVVDCISIGLYAKAKSEEYEEEFY